MEVGLRLAVQRTANAKIVANVIKDLVMFLMLNVG